MVAVTAGQGGGVLAGGGRAVEARAGAGRAQALQGEFFLCDIFDALPKDDLASMEHPLFSLSTRTDLRILSYAHNGVEITVTPSVKGLATLFDKDLLIYCISQLMAGLNAGRAVTRHLRLTAHDLLVATNRQTSGDSYLRLREAFERLAGTRITTNMMTGGQKDGGQEVTSGFGLIESWQIVRATKGGRMVQVSVTLSEWLFRAVMAKSVLTLSRDYFRLRKPLERRVYELARKHCGRQAEWCIGLEVLARKSGSASPLRVFRKMMRDMIAADALPDYHLSEEPGDIIAFRRRDVVVTPDALGPGAAGPALKAATVETARQAMPGWDIYALEAEWRDMWHRSGRPRLRSPDAAFLGWLKKRG